MLETTGGTEHFLSSRVAEVGPARHVLMGMNAAQFQQVALLPQGEFQTFLRASSQERHDVLQHLFRTDRFARIEDWVHDHSRRLRHRAGEGEAAVRRLVDTVADRAGVPTPDELAADRLAQATADDRVLPWVDGLVEESTAAAEHARRDRDEALHEVGRARADHDRAQRRLERVERVAAARRTLDTLAEHSADDQAARDALAAHERATRCTPVLALLAEATEVQATAGRRCDRALDALAAAGVRLSAALPPDSPGLVAELESRLETTRHRIARLEALLPREREAEDARREQQQDQARLVTAEETECAAAHRAAALPDEIETAAAAAGAATTDAAREEALRLALRTLRQRQASAVELAAVLPLLRAAEDQRRDARDRMQDARERVQRLAALRLAGMAAELAGALADGAACQVCGSTEHPRPATAGSDPVTDADQEAADAELAARLADLETAEAECRTLLSRRDAAAATAGDASAEELAAEVAALDARLAAAHEAARRLPSLVETLDGLRAEQQTVAARRAEAATAVSTLRQSVAHHARTVAAVAAEVDQVLADEDGPDGPEVDGRRTVAEALHRTTALLTRLADAAARATEHDDAADRAESVARLAAAAVEQAGFPGPAEAVTARLPYDQVAPLERLVRERADALVRAEAVLAESTGGDDGHPPDVPAGDLAQLVAERRADLVEAESLAEQAARRLALHEDRLAALLDQRARLATAIDQWAPVRDDSLRADSIARLVRGLGHDNQLQMRLSAYVLATRLDQVVAAANERLGHMRDQRYLLQRTGRAERRSAQAGLGLEVVDQWTGDVRAPTTLSGGETFVVSLALALGLADVVDPRGRRHRDRHAVRRRGLRHARRRHPRRRHGPPRRAAGRRPHRRRGQPRQRAPQPDPDAGARRQGPLRLHGHRRHPRRLTPEPRDIHARPAGCARPTREMMTPCPRGCSPSSTWTAWSRTSATGCTT